MCRLKPSERALYVVYWLVLTYMLGTLLVACQDMFQ